MKKIYFVCLIAIILLLGGYIIFTKNNNQTNTTVTKESQSQNPITMRDTSRIPKRNMPATADIRELEVNTQRLHPSKIILCYVLCRNGKIG